GGTSMADAAQLEKVRAIVEADARRSIIVPSAPGKRSKTDPKITDLLYLCHRMAAMGANYGEPFGAVCDRYVGIERDLGLQTNIIEPLRAFERELLDGC